MQSNNSKIITLTLNPSIDHIFKLQNFRTNEVNNCDSFSQIAAGKGINVSKYLNKMSSKSEIFCPMCENASALFSSHLSALNIPAYFHNTPGEIRTNTTIIDSINSSSTHIKCKGFHFDKKIQETLFENLKNRLENNDFLLICGSYPQNFDFDLFNRFLEWAFHKEIKIFIDNDGENLQKIENIDRFFIKPNLQELEAFLEKKFQNIQNLINFLISHEKNPLENQEILVTLGNEGIIYKGKKEKKLIHCKLAANNIVSTVGCGDAILAGFVFARKENKNIEDCLKFAISFAVSKLGKESVGEIDKDEVILLKEKVQVFYY